jgi:hypothetical protein
MVPEVSLYIRYHSRPFSILGQGQKIRIQSAGQQRIISSHRTWLTDCASRHVSKEASTMRLLIALAIATAFALPVTAHAGGKGSGGSNSTGSGGGAGKVGAATTAGSATGGSGAGKASPAFAVKGVHYKKATITTR